MALKKVKFEKDEQAIFDDAVIYVSDPLTRVLSTADISDEVLGFDVRKRSANTP